MHDQKLDFDKIISEQGLHIRFLHTLSLMELLGAHKLSRLVPALSNTTAFLEHIAEEFRHAYFLRSLADKLSKDTPLSSLVVLPLAKRASSNYINKLHRLICLLIKNADLYEPSTIKNNAYLLSTLVIEKRALPFYEAYQQALSKYQMPISVKSILSEEARHLEEMTRRTTANKKLALLIEPSLAIEEKLYSSWVKSLNDELAK